MSSKKKIIPIIIVILLISIVILGAYYYSKNQNKVKDESTENIDASVLNELNIACKNYYDNFKKTKTFLSKYSYLYDDENMIEIKDFVTMGYLKSTENIEKAMILYIKPIDLSSYGDFTSENSHDLKLFTAIENDDKVIVSSCEDNKNAVLTKDEFRELILKYDFNRGEVINPEKGSKEYSSIENAIKSYDNENRQLNFKHIVCNDVYTSVIFVYDNDFKDIREYVLMKGNGTWNVVIKDLEKESNYKVIVNEEFPDFELGMLPLYNLNDYYGKIETEFDNITSLLVQQSIISEDELPPDYSCGVGEFIYFEFKSGKKLIGYVNSEGELKFHDANNYKEAVAYMTEFNKKPPVFILNKN